MKQDPAFPKDPTKQIVDTSQPPTTSPKLDKDGNVVYAYFLTDAQGNTIQPDQAGDTVKANQAGEVEPDTNTNDSPTQISTDSMGVPDKAWKMSADRMTLTLTAAATMPTTLPAGTIARAQVNTIDYTGGMVKDSSGHWNFTYHNSAISVIHWHSPNYVFIQACVAILILVGFESVSSMGEEAKDAKRDIPKAIILSLLIQGGFCYLFEYFAANYFMSSSYPSTTAAGSSAPIGDMMQICGAWTFGSATAGWWFMFWEAITVFLAMIGTTLSCINTGARVTYAMGRDEEVPNHFGLLHGKNATPNRCIWTLATISVVIGVIGNIFYLCDAAATFPAGGGLSAAQAKSIWFIGAFTDPVHAAKFPNSFLVITLISNFGTFMLYMMSCIVAMVAFHEHHMHNFWKHKFIPMFGLLANLACMIFYLVGPFSVAGMSWKESYIAFGFSLVWGIYGLIYFLGRSKILGREVILSKPSITSSPA
jgi:amino acid transporter